ncbi:hypothetical protein EC844_103127 [Acinetobacter calcoaceticus]|uniref:Lipoprotein n=1 Tax=Acinetobacter calcoaceticus TaxID=471 RepID=A0A4R1Y0S3_ACICA|nr:hypothetical protein EC844_103127 [Acinetobacter calcoaceticus]
MHLNQNKLKLTCVMGLGLVLGIVVGCERDQEIKMSALEMQTQSASASQPQQDAAVEAPEPGLKLIDAIHQNAEPRHEQLHDPDHSGESLSAQALQFVGRYHTEMLCRDALVSCEQGKVDYIINLLPDGTSHRTIVHLGKVFSEEDGKVKSYRKDIWTFSADQDEIIIHLTEGADLYFKVDAQHNLHMDLEKSLNSSQMNREFFQYQYPAPSYAYVLTRYQESEHQQSHN